MLWHAAYDAIEKVFFMQVPELNEQYIDYDTEELYNGEMDDTFEMWELMVKAEDKLPSAAKVNQLLDKYTAIALADVEQVEKGTETLEAKAALSCSREYRCRFLHYHNYLPPQKSMLKQSLRFSEKVEIE